MTLVWLDVSAIHHGRQVSRGVMLVDAFTFEAALELVAGRGKFHAEDLVMGYEFELEALPVKDQRAIGELPRFELLSVAQLRAAGLELAPGPEPDRVTGLARVRERKVGRGV